MAGVTTQLTLKLQKCNALAPVCSRGFERVRMAVGSRQPGDCCDTFECKARGNNRSDWGRRRDDVGVRSIGLHSRMLPVSELHCENVKCPPDLEAQEPCPADSVRPPSYVPQGSCCQVTER